jgi:hypothetical protein
MGVIRLAPALGRASPSTGRVVTRAAATDDDIGVAGALPPPEI